MLPPAGISLLYGDGHWYPFLVSFAIVAALGMLLQLREHAGEMLECSADDLELRWGGRIGLKGVPEREVSFHHASLRAHWAAGGPIVSPQVDALCITPLCPHSLSFRPIVARAEADTRVRLVRGNEGTTLVIDGQRSTFLREGQEVRVQLSDKHLELVHNPTFSYWRLLATKLRWAARPRRG